MTVVDELLTAEEAGPIVHLHPDTLLRYARRGRIEVVKVGRKRLFRPAALQAYIDRVTCAADTSAPADRPARNPNRTYKT